MTTENDEKGIKIGDRWVYEDQLFEVTEIDDRTIYIDNGIGRRVATTSNWLNAYARRTLGGRMCIATLPDKKEDAS